MRVLLIADGDATGRALTAALKFGGVVEILEPRLPVVPEALADAIVSLTPGYDAILAPSTSTGKSVLPRVAALLDVMQISDVIEIVSPDTFCRPTYAGNAIETVKSNDPRKIVTIRTSAFDMTSTEAVPRVSLQIPDSPLVRVVAEMETKSDRPPHWFLNSPRRCERARLSAGPRSAALGATETG
jgi:electron transfer flavoprotein alpha subunit